jgi:ribonuclease HI
MAWVRKKKANTKMKFTARNQKLKEMIQRAERWLHNNEIANPILKWETKAWGEIPADFGRK